MVKPGIDYAKPRFIDTDVVNTGRGCHKINKGLTATEAFSGASVFDPTQLKDMSIAEVHMHLQRLSNFALVSQELIDEAKKDVSQVLAFAKNHSNLPNINIKVSRIMMKLNILKKNNHPKRIIQRRMNKQLDARVK